MRKRMTAIRASIADVIDGEFIKDPDSSYVISPFGVQIRRAAFLAFIVRTYSKPGEFASITLDDGTETIQAKAWSSDRRKIDLLSEVENNKLVLLIGRIKQYNDDIYVDPEIIREVSDPNLLTLHMLVRYQTILSETGVHHYAPSTPQTTLSESEISVSDSSDSPDDYSGPLIRQILKFIKQHGRVKGVSLDEIIEFFTAREFDRDDIQMKVLDLQDREEIEEVGIGKYIPSD